MHHFVAALDGSEHIVPLAFDVGAVGVQFRLQAGLGQHALAGRDFFGDRDADSDRDQAEVGDDPHAQPCLTGTLALVEPHSISSMLLLSVIFSVSTGELSFVSFSGTRPRSWDSLYSVPH